MPRRENFDEWGISWERYKELAMFCLQYEQKKRDADALLTLKLSTPIPEFYYTERKITLRNGQERIIKEKHGTFLPHGSGHVSDPVARTAAKREKYLRDIRMIEQAAMATVWDVGVPAKCILFAVTHYSGVQGVYADPDLRPPIGERQFRKLRRKFFWILSEMMDGFLEPMP